MNPAVTPSPHRTHSQHTRFIPWPHKQVLFVFAFTTCTSAVFFVITTHPMVLQACSSPYIGYNISLHTSGSPYICLHIQVCSPISLHKSSILQLPKTSKHFRTWPEQVLSVQVVNRVLMITVESIQQVVEDVMMVGGW